MTSSKTHVHLTKGNIETINHNFDNLIKGTYLSTQNKLSQKN